MSGLAQRLCKAKIFKSWKFVILVTFIVLLSSCVATNPKVVSKKPSSTVVPNVSTIENTSTLIEKTTEIPATTMQPTISPTADRGGSVGGGGFSQTSTPTISPTPTPTISPNSTISPTPTPTISPNSTISPTPTLGPTPTVSPTSTVISTPTAICNDSLWNHTRSPSRLQVIKSCITVTGIVHNIVASQDGDMTFDLILDKYYSNLLNQTIVHSEVVCAEPINATAYPDAIIACSGFAEHFQIKLNDHVQVTGAYVMDRGHGATEWNEIHPVTSIVII